MSHVRRRGAARVTDLADLLDVSEMTVRRDLDMLDEAGLLVKVHGGATVRYQYSADEPGFEAKALRNTAEKAAIAASAAALVMTGASIGVTAGTTTVHLAAELVSVPGLTVVTNSLRVADVLHASPRPDRTVILTGGVRTPSDALVGPIANESLRSFHLDAVFMGVHGMHEHAGFTTPNLLEADTNKAFLASTSQLVVLADHTKWGITGLTTMAELSDAAVCVTDGDIGDDARHVLEEHVGRLVVSALDPVALRGRVESSP